MYIKEMDKMNGFIESDELCMIEIKKLLQKAHKAYKKAQAAEDAVFRALDDTGIDLEASSNAENAEDLESAITCYLNYDECNLSDLLSEIREQYYVSKEKEK